MSTAPQDAAVKDGTPPIPLSELLPFKDSPLMLVVTSDGCGKPHFRCAACGEAADPERPANLVWDDPACIYVLHKSYCCPVQAAETLRTLFPHWCDMDAIAVFLLNNTGGKKAVRKASKLGNKTQHDAL